MAKICANETGSGPQFDERQSPSMRRARQFVTADEYARLNGLTIDSSRLNWHQFVEHDQAINSSLSDLAAGQLIEATQLQECLFRAIIPTTEKLYMPAASLQMLREVCGRLGEDEAAALVSQQCFTGTLTWSSFKLNIPALRSDHGSDCRRLARRIKSFMQVPLPDHRLPLHPIDTSQGDGIEFPSRLVNEEKRKMETIERDGLEVTRETFAYVTQSLKSSITSSEVYALIGEISTYQGVESPKHLTPLLSPMSSSCPEHFIPEGETCQVPYLSDSCSKLSEEIEGAERQLLKTELNFWCEIMKKNDVPESYDDLDVSDMIRTGKLRSHIGRSSPEPVARNLKIEVPLLLCGDDHTSTVQGTRVLALDDLSDAKELIESSDTLSGSDGPTGQLVALFQTSAASVTRFAEQEKLRPLDATVRVTVPVMDFSIPVPEWEERIWEAKEMFQWVQKNLGIDWYNSFKWPHNRAAEQRLAWVPLPHVRSKKLVLEQLEVNAASLEFFLDGDSDDESFTSANYVYKEPGLAVLRSETNDDEGYLAPLQMSVQPLLGDSKNTGFVVKMTSPGEPAPTLLSNSPSTASGTASTSADLTNLLNRRKRQIEEALLKRRPDAEQRWPLAADPEVSASDIIDPTLISSTNVLRGFVSEYTDFGPLVDNFLEMHFPKKQKLTHSSYFTQQASTKSASQFKSDEAARLMPPPPKPVPALAPTINRPETPPRIVISSAISPNLIQQLERLVPAIELIPRNYERHRTDWCHSGTELPNLDEADIVVSPATGILVTTMVQLRQRAIPGGQLRESKTSITSVAAVVTKTTTTTNFFHVLESVVVRHERVVVLVSEGNRHNETASPLSQSDARALAELQGFGAGLSVATAHVHVVYVGGGVETLAKWIAAVVCENYAREAAAVRELLLPVETSWEVFLRRAGMNVFAAQVVLGKLKVPDGGPAIGGQGGQMFGLPLFVTMSREQRVELFAGALGGRRVLDRVSDVIDGPWGKRAVNQLVVNSTMSSKWEAN